MRCFVKAESLLIPINSITSVDMAGIEQGFVDIAYDGGKMARAHDLDAFEIVMLLKPAGLEGKRLRWIKNAWAFHNLVAHPLMQIMVWLGFKKLAIRLHDVTVPRPTGLK